MRRGAALGLGPSWVSGWGGRGALVCGSQLHSRARRTGPTSLWRPMDGRKPLGKQLSARGVQELNQKLKRATKLEIFDRETLKNTESHR
jgi:hypothetical protein